MTEEMVQARFAAWTAGVVAPWYLRDSQLDIYRLLHKHRNAFIEAARRFGKTTSIASFVIEMLRANPGWICRWCFPFKNQAREVLFAEMAKIQKHCPEHLKFKYSSTDSVFIGPGDSRIYIRGVNEDRGESARGSAANIVVADEYGFWVEAEYIIKSVLGPQLQNQDGRWLIKTSTPPPDLDHVYYKDRELAVREERFIQKTIYDNEALTYEELQEIIADCGGVNSTSFRRERLCEAVSDPDKLVIPEWDENLNIVEDDYPRPEFCDFYTVGDSGKDDNTFVVFAWYDFLKNEVVVDYEFCKRGKTTKFIVRNCKRFEKVLYKGVKPYRRHYDASEQLIFDIVSDHQWTVSLPWKADAYAAIHELRSQVGARRFKVKRRCRQLIRQMKVGMWKDDKHTDFQRSVALGHLDGIAAAKYLNRAIDRERNPIPRNMGLSHETHFIPRSLPELTPSEKALTSVFGSKKGFR